VFTDHGSRSGWLQEYVGIAGRRKLCRPALLAYDMRIDLHIGGFTIALDEPDNHPVVDWPVPLYEAYLTSEADSPDLWFAVSIIHPLPVLPTGELLFDAEHGQWRLFKAGSEYLFESLDPMTLLPRCRAILDRDFSVGQVWLCGQATTEGRSWNPLDLLNPLIDMCLLTRLTRAGGLLLHAAGVVSDDGVWVFTGDSGAGKSTLSGWCKTQGMAVLNDERIIMKRKDDRLVVWGTPWVGTGGVSMNQCGPLARLHCIRHGNNGHSMRGLRSAEASQLILRQCTVPHWDPDGLEGMLSLLDILVTEADCVDLAFEHDPKVVDYLRLSSATPFALIP
jgi:hypothetical protein